MSDVNVKVGLTNQAFKSGLDKLKSDLASWKSQQVSSFAGLGQSLAGSFAGIASVSGIVELVKSTVEMAKTLRNTSAEANVSVESFQSLSRAFSKGGTDAEETAKGLVHLAEHITAAREGNEHMIASFQRAGVTWSDLHSLSPEQILMKMAAGFHEIKDPAESTAIAVELLGKSGASMAVTLRKGADELARLREQMKGLSTEDVEALATADREIGGLFKKWQAAEAHGVAGAVQFARTDDKMGAMEGVAGRGVGMWARSIGMSGGISGWLEEKVRSLFPQRSEEAATQAELDIQRGRVAEGKRTAAAATPDFTPVDPATAKELERQAAEAMKTTLQGVRTAQGNSDNDLDNMERMRVEARDIAEIERRSADSRLEAEAHIAGFTSKREENAREQELIAKQLADIEARKAAAETPQAAASIDAEQVELQEKGKMLAAEHLRLEQQIAHAEREVADTVAEGAIELLELTDREGAFKARVAQIEAQIAANTIEAKEADELRRLEIEKQNAALTAQEKQLKANKALADAKKTPQQQADERAEDRHNRAVLRAAEARQASKDRAAAANSHFGGGRTNDEEWNKRFRKPQPKPPRKEDFAGPPAPAKPLKPDMGNMEHHLDKIATDLAELVRKSNVA